MRLLVLIISLFLINNSYAEYADCYKARESELCFSLFEAKSGNPDSLAKLGLLYWDGNNTQKNDVQSLMWYILAAKEDRRYEKEMNAMINLLGDDYVKAARKLARKCLSKDYIDCDIYNISAGPYGN